MGELVLLCIFCIARVFWIGACKEHAKDVRQSNTQCDEGGCEHKTRIATILSEIVLKGEHGKKSQSNGDADNGNIAFPPQTFACADVGGDRCREDSRLLLCTGDCLKIA